MDDCEAPGRARGLCGAHFVALYPRAEGATSHCVRDGCSKAPKARGLCAGHHTEYQRAIAAECKLESCDAPVDARRLCNQHYKEDLAHERGTCGVPACSNGVHNKALAMCQAHVKQLKAGKSPEELRVWAPVPDEDCLVPHCEAPAGSSIGLCVEHRSRQRRGLEDWDAPIKRLMNARGDGYINASGYRMLWDGDAGRHRPAHHLAFEAVLGRELRTKLGEQIHHINRVRLDNRTDGPPTMNERGNYVSGNLELWVTSHPAGAEIGPQLDHALEQLERYQHLLDARRLETLTRIASSLLSP